MYGSYHLAVPVTGCSCTVLQVIVCSVDDVITMYNVPLCPSFAHKRALWCQCHHCYHSSFLPLQILKAVMTIIGIINRSSFSKLTKREATCRPYYSDDCSSTLE